MSDELKACQKCGAANSSFERWINDERKTLYRIICRACSFAPDHWEESAEKAIEYWNSRPLEDAAIARAEKAEADRKKFYEAIIRGSAKAAILIHDSLVKAGATAPNGGISVELAQIIMRSISATYAPKGSEK